MPPDQSIKLRQPRRPFGGIRRLQCHGAEGIHVANLIVIDRPVDARPPIRPPAKDIGNLQTRDIETFRRRRKRHGTSQERLSQRSERDIPRPRCDNLAMDLIGNDNHSMPEGNLPHPVQFPGRPDASRRIVRVAQDQNTVARIRAGILKTLIIKPIRKPAIGLIKTVQRHIHDAAAVVPYGGEEAVEDRRLHDHAVARSGEGLDDGRQSRHHARRILDPFALQA